MQAGRLRHLVVIEQKAVTKDAMSQDVESWSTFATVRADIQPLRGREFFEAQKASSEITTKIFMRYIPSLGPAMRVKHGSVVYKIIEIINPGMRKVELQIMAKEQPQSVT